MRCSDHHTGRLASVGFVFLFLAFISLNGQERFRKSPPPPDPLPQMKFPEMMSATLSNSLELVLVRRENLPLIHMKLIIRAGECHSPENLPGLATLTARMLDKGTLTYSSSDIEEAIESIGGNFSYVVYPDYSLFSFSFLEDYFDEALDLLSKMILQPLFHKTEYENAKRVLYYDLYEKASDPDFIAKRLLFQLLFQDHPYRKASFNRDGIKNFDRKDLIAFFDRYYRPNNAAIILSGNLGLSAAARKVSQYLNTWKSKSLEFFRAPLPQVNEELRICVADIPQNKEATIFLGNIVFPWKNEDFFSLLVLNQVLGGSPASRLFMNLRESKEFAYYAFSNIDFFKICGLLAIQAKVRPEAVYDSITEILKEIQKIQKEKIPNYEIEQSKSRLIGNFPMNIETHEDLSLKITEMKVFELDEAFWNKYYENIMFVDSDKVWKTARNSSLQTPILVVAGDKNILIEHMREFNEVLIYDSNGVYQYKIVKGEEE